MKDFKNRVAVITGAASGIGRSLAIRAAREGMKVVLAGINEANLVKVEQELKAEKAEALIVPTDVTKETDLSRLARRTLNTYGGVHLLINNAGVGGGTTAWESSLADWHWIMEVNLWGVVHGIRVFVPVMLSQDCDCHIVNTASISGLRALPGMGIYCVAKYGVVALTETLYQELGQRKAKLKVSVLCPGYVRTRIGDSGRNRPSQYVVGAKERRLTDKEMDAAWDAIQSSNKGVVLSPEVVADRTFEAIRKEQLYIYTHEGSGEWVREHLEDVVNCRNPAIMV